FADHLVADPRAWELLRAADPPTVDRLTESMFAAVEAGTTGQQAITLLRKRYRDQLMLLAAIDLAATVENEPVLPYRRVGQALTDLADAALTAAFAVAVATVCPDGP